MLFYSDHFNESQNSRETLEWNRRPTRGHSLRQTTTETFKRCSNARNNTQEPTSDYKKQQDIEVKYKNCKNLIFEKKLLFLRYYQQENVTTYIV